MPRTIWLAFGCLLCLGVLFALRASTGARPAATRSDAVPPAAIEDGPLAKSDRLPSLPLERAETKVSVTTVKIAPDQPEAKASPKAAQQAGSERNEVTTWHWHAGSKTIKRTTSQPKSERER